MRNTSSIQPSPVRPQNPISTSSTTPPHRQTTCSVPSYTLPVYNAYSPLLPHPNRCHYNFSQHRYRSCESLWARQRSGHANILPNSKTSCKRADGGRTRSALRTMGGGFPGVDLIAKKFLLDLLHFGTQLYGCSIHTFSLDISPPTAMFTHATRRHCKLRLHR